MYSHSTHANRNSWSCWSCVMLDHQWHAYGVRDARVHWPAFAHICRSNFLNLVSFLSTTLFLKKILCNIYIPIYVIIYLHKSISENLFSLYQQFFIPASTLGRQGHDCEGLHNHFLWSLHQMKYINLLLHFFRQKDTNYCNFSFSRIFHKFQVFLFLFADPTLPVGLLRNR